MQISLIVAYSKNRAIGKDNQIPWYLPADLQFFKKTTMGSPIIMGRKTFESIGRPLPGRVNIVVTHQKQYKAEGIVVKSSLLEAIEYAQKQDFKEIFIIGGGEIYRQALPVCQKAYCTEVDVEVADAIAFFPELPTEDWLLKSEDPHEPDAKNVHAYNFKIYERISPITLISLG